jgi:hypothetical protein
MLPKAAQPKLFFPTCFTTATSQAMILERNNGQSGYSLLLHKPIYIDIIRQCRCRSKTRESMLNQNACRVSLSYLSFWKINFTACDGSLGIYRQVRPTSPRIMLSDLRSNSSSLRKRQTRSCSFLLASIDRQARVEKICQFVISPSRALNRLFWWYLQPSH